MNILRKPGIYFLSCILMLTTFSSCFEENKELPTYISDDARITEFSFAHDSIKDLASTSFSIDNEQGLIYNYDSIAYGTDLSFGGVITFTVGDNTGGRVAKISGTDTVWLVSGKDTLNIHNPIHLRTYAPNGAITQKEYTVTVNVHSLDPDTLITKEINPLLSCLSTTGPEAFLFKEKAYNLYQDATKKELYQSENMTTWAKLSDVNIPTTEQVVRIFASDQYVFAHTDARNVYMSSDALSWTKLNLGHPVIALLGYMEKGNIQDPGLICIIEKEGENKFGFYSKLTEWDENMPTVAADFPIQDFSVITYIKHYTNRISLIGGLDSSSNPLNSVWTTENGTNWAKINNSEKETQFPVMYGANAFIYDGEIWLINGRFASGEYNNHIYYSIDEGNTWSLRESKCDMPENYPLREGASVIVDKEAINFYIIGGFHSGTILEDTWKMYRMGNSFINRK